MDIIIIAALAIFVLFRLYKVLGSRTGFEKPFSPSEPTERSTHEKSPKSQNKAQHKTHDKAQESVIDVNFEQTEADVKGGQDVLDQLKKEDPNFTVPSFLKGAQIAFEAILNAFAACDEGTLKSLLSPKIFSLFMKEVEKRKSSHEELKIRIHDLTAEITDARFVRQFIEIDVAFSSEQTHTFTSSLTPKTSLPHQEVIGCKDIWTFQRKRSSQDLNWVLINTQEGVDTDSLTE